MTLSTLLQGIAYTSPSDPALIAGCEITHITEDSRAVKPGTLFVALRGAGNVVGQSIPAGSPAAAGTEVVLELGFAS